MKPKFTEKQLGLIGECVLDTICRLRDAQKAIPIADARVFVNYTIDNLNEILTILAEASHEK